MRAFRGEQLGHRQPQPASRAGDERNPICKTSHGIPLFHA